VADAIELVLQELKKIKRNPVNSGELRRCKEFYTGQLKLALEDTLDHMLWIGETTITLDKTYSLNEVLREVGRVKPQDILEAARIVFSNNRLNLALIGPLEAAAGR